MYNKKVLIKTIMNEYQFLAIPFEKGEKPHGQGEASIVYDDLREKDLETVLPASSDFGKIQVMVLKGDFCGELGHILEKNKRKEQVTVQLNEAAGMQIIQLDMDDVCMYV